MYWPVGQLKSVCRKPKIFRYDAIWDSHGQVAATAFSDFTFLVFMHWLNVTDQRGQKVKTWRCESHHVMHLEILTLILISRCDAIQDSQPGLFRRFCLFLQIWQIENQTSPNNFDYETRLFPPSRELRSREVMQFKIPTWLRCVSTSLTCFYFFWHKQNI